MIGEGFVEAIHLLLKLDPAVTNAALRSLWISALAVGAASLVGISIGLVLARNRFVGKKLLVFVFRAGMAVPTVLIGLLLFGLLSRRGVLGDAHILFTPWAIVVGEFLLALPIVTALTHGGIQRLDRRVFETARTLGAGVLQRCGTYLSEARLAIALAVLTAFGRCITELGIAVLVGGNIPDRTRTLPTAIALETSKGEFARGIAMGLILLVVAMGVILIVAWFSPTTDEAAA